MALNNVVNGWDRASYAWPSGSEPTSVVNRSAAGLALITMDTGPAASLGVIRDSPDRATGRTVRNQWLEGRVAPIPWTVVGSVKKRAAVDSASIEAVLLKAAGLVATTNAGTSVVLSYDSAPIDGGAFVPADLQRIIGTAPAASESEVLRGCAVQTLTIEGGDKELRYTFEGTALSKESQGTIETLTVDSSATTISLGSAAAARAAGVGYYQCESEIIRVTAVDYATGDLTVVRAQMSTSAASHTSKPAYPLRAPPTYATTPITEAMTTNVEIAGVSLRATSWRAKLQTGMEALPGETGSKFSQGHLARRTDMAIEIAVIAKGEDLKLIQRAAQRDTVAVKLEQGTVAGGKFALSAPYCELDMPTLTEPENGPAEFALTFRCRENSGNDMFTITLT